MAVQRINRAAGQRIIRCVQELQDLILAKTAIYQHRHRAGDELIQLPITQQARRNVILALLAIHHKPVGIDVIMHLGHRNAKHLRNIRQRQQLLISQQSLKLITRAGLRGICVLVLRSTHGPNVTAGRALCFGACPP